MDWNYWIGRKYDLLGQNAAADTSRAASLGLTSAADANINNVRAAQIPRQTDADIAESAARTHLTDINATLAPGLAKASEAASYGSANANNAQVPLYGAQAKSTLGGTTSLGALGLTTNPIIQRLIDRLGGLGLTSGN